jgi:hypothetical protein
VGFGTQAGFSKPCFVTWCSWGMPALMRPPDVARLPAMDVLGFAEIERRQFNVDQRGGEAM